MKQFPLFDDLGQPEESWTELPPQAHVGIELLDKNNFMEYGRVTVLVGERNLCWLFIDWLAKAFFDKPVRSIGLTYRHYRIVVPDHGDLMFQFSVKEEYGHLTGTKNNITKSELLSVGDQAEKLDVAVLLTYDSFFDEALQRFPKASTVYELFRVAGFEDDNLVFRQRFLNGKMVVPTEFSLPTPMGL